MEEYKQIEEMINKIKITNDIKNKTEHDGNILEIVKKWITCDTQINILKKLMNDRINIQKQLEPYIKEYCKTKNGVPIPLENNELLYVQSRTLPKNLTQQQILHVLNKYYTEQKSQTPDSDAKKMMEYLRQNRDIVSVETVMKNEKIPLMKRRQAN